MTATFVIASLLLLTLGQVLQKIAADAATSADAMLPALIRSRTLWLAVVCMAAGTATWLAVLSRMEVSRAYPILSLGVVLTTTVSWLWLHEKVSPRRWSGVMLICAGVLLVSTS